MFYTNLELNIKCLCVSFFKFAKFNNDKLKYCIFVNNTKIILYKTTNTQTKI